MNTIPKISVVLPSLNVVNYISECIESVINQTLKNIEIICVDAGSTDGTWEILQEYAAQDKRIKVIHSNKKSYGYQVNLGLDEAKGKYFAIVETDDYIKPAMYETLCQVADKNDLDIIKADFRVFYGEGEERSFTYRNIIPDSNMYDKILNPDNNLGVFKANLYTWAGIYSLRFLRENNIRHNETPGASYQDNGFWFQTFCQAKRIMFYHKDFYQLRRDNPNSSIKSREKIYCSCDEFDFIRDFLERKPNLKKRYAPVCAYYRFANYEWNLNRIADQYKYDFLYRFAKDFKKIISMGELKESLYSKAQLERLYQIVNDYEKYYFVNIYKEKEGISSEQLKKIIANIPTQKERQEIESQMKKAMYQLENTKKELREIQSSWSFKIGRFCTWIPRKLRGGILCYKEHGGVYTWNRFLEHISQSFNCFHKMNNKKYIKKRDQNFPLSEILPEGISRGEENKNAVCYITDEGFLMPTIVSITSLVKNKKPEKQIIIIVLSNNLTERSKALLLSFNAHQGVTIRVIDLAQNELFQNIKSENPHVSTTALNKFELGNILTNFNSVLYIDGDTIIQKDLSDLFNLDLGNNYGAVVKDYRAIKSKPNPKDYLSLHDESYFNSGVMLLNLQQMRKDNIAEKLLKYRKEGVNHFMDQDALNVLFSNHIIFLPIFYNAMYSTLSHFTAKEICKYYDLPNLTLKEILKNSYILHFCSPTKPWKYSDSWNADIWYFYFKVSPCANFKLNRISFYENNRR